MTSLLKFLIYVWKAVTNNVLVDRSINFLTSIESFCANKRSVIAEIFSFCRWMYEPNSFAIGTATIFSRSEHLNAKQTRFRNSSEKSIAYFCYFHSKVHFISIIYTDFDLLHYHAFLSQLLTSVSYVNTNIDRLIKCSSILHCIQVQYRNACSVFFLCALVCAIFHAFVEGA